MNTCKTCKFWKKYSTYSTYEYDTITGICRELIASGKLVVELIVSDDGCVDYIETEEDFGCILHKSI
jgi:hypothetical protein